MVTNVEPAQCRDKRKLKQILRNKINNIIYALENEGYKPFIIETYRSEARQKWLLSKKKTWVTHSKHQNGEACDIGFKVNGKVIWDVGFRGWARLAHYAREQDLIAGHDWKKLDCPHVEMK